MKKKINLHIFEVFETGKKTMLLKGKPIVSTSASRDWFPRYVVHKKKSKDQSRAYYNQCKSFAE